MWRGLRGGVLAIAIVAPLAAAASAAVAEEAEEAETETELSGATAPPPGDAGTGSGPSLVAPLAPAPRPRGGADLRLVPDGAAGALPSETPRPGGPRIAGTAFIGWRGREGETTGALATVSPGGPAFVRIAVEATPRSELGAARLAWAAGFEDARAGTFFARVEDRGPVQPDARFTFRRAELTAGVKLPLLCAGALCLAPTAFATVPFAGGPFVGARTTLALGHTWYAAAGLGWTVPGVLEASGGAPRWRMQYGVGRWDARPGTLYVAYEDELALAALTRVRAWRPADRQGRGALTAGVTWEH